MRKNSSFASARSEYRAGYRLSEINQCPGCGQSQWFVGRMSAECAFCHTALPISGIHAIGNAVTRTSPRPPLLAA